MRTKREEFLLNIVDNIYVEMYKQSTPSADYHKLMEEFKKQIPENATQDEVIKMDIKPFYNDYILSEEKSIDIINKETSKFKLKKHEKDLIKRTAWLGASPRFTPKEK